MSLIKRSGSNHWQIDLVKFGRRVRVSTNTSNVKIARKIHAEVVMKLETGTYLKKEMPRIRFTDLLKTYLKVCSKDIKSSHERDCTSSKTFIEYFGQKLIDRISGHDIEHWRHWRLKQISKHGRPISNASVNRELAFLKALFNKALDWEYLERNPALRVKKLRGENSRDRALSEEEVQKLIDHSPPYLQSIIYIAVKTTMRRGEILTLKWKNVDLENQFIHVSKTKNDKGKTIPIDDETVNELRSLKRENSKSGDFVFANEDGKPRKSIREAFNNSCRRAGIDDFRFHDLRHTGASLLANGGCDILKLQNILGHKTMAMTQRYSHLMPGSYEQIRQIQSATMGNFMTQNSPQSGILEMSSKKKSSI